MFLVEEIVWFSFGLSVNGYSFFHGLGCIINLKVWVITDCFLFLCNKICKSNVTKMILSTWICFGNFLIIFVGFVIEWLILILMSTPTSIPIPLLFLSLLLLAISVTCPRKFCSVKCATKGCNGDSVNNCNSKCMANWVVSGSTCVPNNNNFFYMQNTSPDIPGGSLIVMVSSITIYHSSFCGPTSLYGPFYGSATTIRIAEAAGIAAAYYAFTIYVGIQTIDSSSSEYWKKSSSFFIDFSNSSGPIQSNSYGMFGSTRVEG